MSTATTRKTAGVRTWTLILLVCAVAIGGGLWLGMAGRDGGTNPEPPAPVALTQGTLLPNPRALADFKLVDQDGAPLRLSDLKGHWTFLAIGYTSCPHVCPMTMATFKSVASRLAFGSGDSPRFLLVSTDPERDTPERLAEYVRSFTPAFLGATGEEVQLRALSAQLGLVFAMVEDREAAADDYIDHSASILLIDPQGRLTAVFGAPHDAAGLATDFQTIAHN